MLFGFYNVLFFNIFNMNNTVNNESVKYITKNAKTEDSEFFLKIKNQRSASTISSSSLTETATRVCMVLESGSPDCPLRKIITVEEHIREKAGRRSIVLRGRAGSAPRYCMR
jgi:hypothetical protein